LYYTNICSVRQGFCTTLQLFYRSHLAQIAFHAGHKAFGVGQNLFRPEGIQPLKVVRIFLILTETARAAIDLTVLRFNPTWFDKEFAER
jgi:hypothetical protein